MKSLRLLERKTRALAGKIIPELKKKYTQNHFIKLPGLKYEGDGFADSGLMTWRA